MSQLALPLQLADHAVFSTFLADGNETLVATLADIAAGRSATDCWLYGGTATGKTHLLQAVCEAAGDAAAYLPLAVLADAGPEILVGQENRALVCIDDIDTVLGDEPWDMSLFALCHRLADREARLVVSASAPPRDCNIGLHDLASRLQQLAVFQVNALSEPQRVAALQLRADHRGLDLPDETAAYLLRRSRRDMASLYALLDRLDDAALQAQRKLTIPFVREVLGKN